VYTSLMRLADLSDDDPLKFYLRELAAVQPVTSNEGTELLKQMRSDNEQAQLAEKRLIEANLSLLVTVAERFRSHGCEIRTTADRRTVELRTD
jgi:DNA-directed RNA polymerase sigma subunit (sigma70/sigma32)